jgi:hypothetical protein
VRSGIPDQSTFAARAYITQNNGNWQWVASVGVDPAPYFRRLVKPTLQQRKFDSDGDYVAPLGA